MTTASLLLTGCVTYQPATAADEPHFAHLREGNLAEFDQRIGADLQTGTTSDATLIGEAWLAFLACEELPDASPGGAAERWAWELLQMEDARRATYIVSRRAPPSRMVDLVYSRLASDKWLRWEPLEETPTDAVVWPAEDEDWADELATAKSVERACDELVDRLTLSEEDEANRPDGFELIWPHYARLFAALTRANAAAERAGSALRGPASEHDLNANIYGVLAAQQLAALDEDRDDIALPKDLVSASEAGLRAAIERAETIEAPGTPTLAVAYLLRAQSELLDDRPAEARASLTEARRVGLPAELEWRARHIALWLEWRLGDWDAVAAFGAELPPPGSADYGSFVYRLATGALRAGDEDSFLRIVTDALGDREWSNDRYLEATWNEMLVYLAAVPFDPRVEELIENLGPRGETYERMEEFGRVALDQGRPDVADDVATWLLARDSDSRRHPRYHAIRAMADFLRDNPEGFRQHLRELTVRDSKLLEAIPKSRRARFFERSDRELARILSLTMPMMAEWGDTPEAQASRKVWLELLVEEIQLFLRNADETAARSQLVELYKLAGELLADHPRGYAERVGREDGEPIVLGTVRVDRTELEERSGFTDIAIPVPTLLPPVPRDAPVAEWDDSWPAVFPEDSKTAPEAEEEAK